MSKRDKIKELYFDYKYKQIEIAKELNVSNKYISRILIQDSRYKTEKEERKKFSKQKHEQKTKEYIANKRKNRNIDIVYEYMRCQHNQASFELSGSKNNINNRAFRKWNASAYKYNPQTQSYHLIKNLTATHDVPKIIR